MKYSKRLFITITPVQLAFVEAEAGRLTCTAPEIMRKLIDGELRRQSRQLHAAAHPLNGEQPHATE
jgi:hypothetical protein